MYVQNDGKLRWFTITLFKRKLEVNVWFTGDCTSSLHTHARLLIYLWGNNPEIRAKYTKLIFKRQFKLFKLK